MNATTSTALPDLALPGAGLPWPELKIANLMFRWGWWRTSREQSAANITKEQEAIHRMVSRYDDADCRRRVLIARLRGLEDSSRYWSVFMTLEHLRIVNHSVTGAIKLLAAGHIPPGTASTAAVKPGDNIDSCVVAAFEASCRNLARVVEAIPDLKTKEKYAHPWFGPLDASGWHFMAGFHMRLHRRQIEAILSGESDPVSA